MLSLEVAVPDTVQITSSSLPAARVRYGGPNVCDATSAAGLSPVAWLRLAELRDLTIRSGAAIVRSCLVIKGEVRGVGGKVALCLMRG